MLKSNVNDFQYLFLGGIIGEVLSLPFVGNYLKVNKKILTQMGVETINCHTLNSYKSAQDNAKTLATMIKVLHKKHRKPLVIFGHSKACLELILSMMDHFPLFQSYVKQVICVQPPFQGSSVFERYNFLKHLNPYWPGLKCLEPEHYSDHFADNLINNSEFQSYLKKSFLVVRAYKSSSRDVSWIIRPSHFVMKRLGHDNDGLVKLRDQRIPFADYKEVVMEMDHSDLFTSSLLSNRDDQYRKEVMVQLINFSIEQEVQTASDQESDQARLWSISGKDEAEDQASVMN
jgi:hypothetical protein